MPLSFKVCATSSSSNESLHIPIAAGIPIEAQFLSHCQQTFVFLFGYWKIRLADVVTDRLESDTTFIEIDILKRRVQEIVTQPSPKRFAQRLYLITDTHLVIHAVWADRLAGPDSGPGTR